MVPGSESTTGVFAFDHPHDVPPRDLGDLLGGKGAGLAEMTTTLGIDVPPGFTVGVPICRAYRESGWPDGLDEQVVAHVEALSARMGRAFGDPADPLLLAVRSGAPVSMPGMLDTVLNLGLNGQTIKGMVATSGDETFAWDSYRRFVAMYATTVMGVPADALEEKPNEAGADALCAHVRRLLEQVERSAGRPVPEDPMVQLHEAVDAVFRSWDCTRARAYRAKEGLDEDAGTAVNVQAMVFGNRGPDSGTGVVFTRDPATGDAVLYGDYLPCAQGEDVVAGTARTMPISHLREHQPAAYDDLVAVLRRLEVHYRDLCDVEFTLEDGRLWLLQTRIGKRGAVAAVRIAADLVDDPEVRLSPEEVAVRVSPELRRRAREEVLARVDGGSDDRLLGTGLGASPGRVQGRVVLSSEQAAVAPVEDGDLILVRRETSPEDVAGMAVSAGILTTRGGLVSHAAVVARGWGLPAVVGASDLRIEDGCVLGAGGLVARAGDVITIDGANGKVWLGALEAEVADVARVVDDELPQLARLEALVSPSDARDTEGAAT